jgi:uncharacterized protein with gpF-like domain
MEILSRLKQIAHTAASAKAVGTWLPLRRLRKARPFKPSAVAVQAYKLVIAEKVAYIDRMPAKYRAQIKEAIWTCVMKGYDEAGLQAALHEKFGLSKPRAQQIAQSQCNMARAVMQNAVHLEQGVKEGIWQHEERCTSSAHKAYHGRRYRLARGANFDGKWAWPGSEPQCSCTGIPLGLDE